MSSDDEFDQYFDDMPWEEVGKLLDAPPTPINTAAPVSQWASSSRSHSTASTVRQPSFARPSTQFRPPLRKPSRNEFQSAARLFTPPGPSSTKRPREPEYESPESSLKKMKMYAQKVLKGFEEDYSCPICFDLIVGCHLTNPCGHAACGSCSTKWAANNKSKPTCFACRAPMNRSTPVIPGLIIDSLIEKQINLLAENGDDEWLEHGANRKEWEQRKASWAKEKSNTKDNVKKEYPNGLEARRRAWQREPVDIITLSDGTDISAQDSDHDDDDEVEEEPVHDRINDFFQPGTGRNPFGLENDILRYPRVSRRMLQNLPVADNPRDEDYVPDTQNVAPQNEDPGPFHRFTRRSRTGQT